MCGCRSRVNKDLAEMNARIADGFLFTHTGPLARMDLAPPTIVLEKIDARKRGKLPNLLAAFCPFCGEKYPEEAP